MPEQKNWTYNGYSCTITMTTYVVDQGRASRREAKSVEVTVNGFRWVRRCSAEAPVSVTLNQVASKVEQDIDSRHKAGQTMPKGQQ